MIESAEFLDSEEPRQPVPAGPAHPTPSWQDQLTAATALLSVGSTVLLLAALIVGPLPSSNDAGVAVFVAGWLAAFVHLAGWARLVAPLRIFEGRMGRLSRAVFAGSVIGWLTSLVLLLRMSDGYFLVVLASGVVPFIPIVWAPVVVAHAGLFLVLGSLTSDRVSRILTVIGSGWLAAASIWGLALFVQHAPTDSWFYPSAWLFAGLTSPGYLLIALGWRRAAIRSALAAGPAPNGSPQSSSPV